MRFLMCFVLVLLAGCQRPMTNEEVLAQVKICHSGGMDYETIYYAMTYEVIAVHCMKPGTGS